MRSVFAFGFCAVVLMACLPAVAGGIPFTARGIFKDRELKEGVSLNSANKLTAVAVLPDGEESPEVCVLGPIRSMDKIPRPGADALVLPPHWLYYVEPSTSMLSLESLTAIIADVREKSIPGLSLLGTRINDQGAEVLTDLPDLEYLSLGRTLITDATLPRIAKLKGLIALDLGGLRGLTDEGLKALEYLPDLRVLSLEDSRAISSAGLKALEKMKSLAWLDLTRTQISDQGLRFLRPIRSLHFLDLSSCTRVTDRGMVHVGALKYLEYLGLHGIPMTDLGFAELSKLRSLRGLDLSRTKVTGTALAQMKTCRKLTWLSLAAVRLTANSAQGLSNLRNLKYLDLKDTGLPGAALSVIERMKKLEELHLKGVTVDDDALGIVAGLTSLRRLILQRGDGLSDEALMGLTKLKKLELLDLYGSSGITQPAMKSLAAALPNCEIIPPQGGSVSGEAPRDGRPK